MSQKLYRVEGYEDTKIHLGFSFIFDNNMPFFREDHLTSVKSDSEAEMDDLSDTSVECERREDRTKTNSMVQLMSHIQVNTERTLMSHLQVNTERTLMSRIQVNTERTLMSHLQVNTERTLMSHIQVNTE
jgi:hypothetical protein